jgi:exosome complex RNA-binding protein Csl4
MATQFRKFGIKMSRCMRCDHDLVVKRDGKLYCSNGNCGCSRKGHPNRKHPTFAGAPG